MYTSTVRTIYSSTSLSNNNTSLNGIFDQNTIPGLQSVTHVASKMSATTTIKSGSTAPANKMKTSATLSEAEALQKIAVEKEAKRVANVATQKRRLEVANEKAAEELLFRGKDAVLKYEPRRPTRRPAKKNRKSLPPPSNKEHDTRTATMATKAVIKKKELAALSIIRPTYNFTQVVEQRMVNGFVERVNQPAISQSASSKPTSVQSKSLSVDSYANIVEQRVVNGVAERIPESVDAPRAATSDIDTDLDSAAKTDNDAEEDMLELIRESSVIEQGTDSTEDNFGFVEAASTIVSSRVYDVPMTDVDDDASLPSSVGDTADEMPAPVEEAAFEALSCYPSAILSMPNAALYPSCLSRQEEAELVAMHVTPLELPITVSKQKMLTKVEEKAAKTAKDSKLMTTVKYEVSQKHLELETTETTTGIADPINLADDGYVTALLKAPNGLGRTKESRELHEKLVAMHVAPFSLPVTVPKKQMASKAERKAAKADRKMPFSTKKDVLDFVASLLSKPNGPGETKKVRDCHNNIVEMHVAPCELILSFQQQQKKIKKAGFADTHVPEPIYELVAVDMSVAEKEPITADGHATSAVAGVDANDFTHEGETLIEDDSKIGPLPFDKVKDELQNIAVHVVDIVDKQTLIIPDDTTLITPPASDPDLPSSSSDYLKSNKTSRRSSEESSVESVRSKAEKARTTFLGKTSLETFVNTLDLELCDGTTTKDDICEAFASLAGRSTTGLDSVKIQRNIKLGSTSLYGFLRQLEFDDDELTVVGKVMKVFNKAAENDSPFSKLDVALWLAESSQDGGSRRGLRSQRASPVGGCRRVSA